MSSDESNEQRTGGGGRGHFRYHIDYDMPQQQRQQPQQQQQQRRHFSDDGNLVSYNERRSYRGSEHRRGDVRFRDAEWRGDEPWQSEQPRWRTGKRRQTERAASVGRREEAPSSYQRHHSRQGHLNEHRHDSDDSMQARAPSQARWRRDWPSDEPLDEKLCRRCGDLQQGSDSDIEYTRRQYICARCRRQRSRVAAASAYNDDYDESYLEDDMQLPSYSGARRLEEPRANWNHTRSIMRRGTGGSESDLHLNCHAAGSSKDKRRAQCLPSGAVTYDSHADNASDLMHRAAAAAAASADFSNSELPTVSRCNAQQQQQQATCLGRSRRCTSARQNFDALALETNGRSFDELSSLQQHFGNLYSNQNSYDFNERFGHSHRSHNKCNKFPEHMFRPKYDRFDPANRDACRLC